MFKQIEMGCLPMKYKILTKISFVSKGPWTLKVHASEVKNTQRFNAVGSFNNEKAVVSTFNNKKGLVGAFAEYQILCR